MTETGKTPQRRIGDKTKALSVRIPKRVMDELRQTARDDYRTVSSLVMKIVVQWYERRERGKND